MSAFKSLLPQIHTELEVKNSHFEENVEDYFRIREYIIKRLCETPVFKMIFGGIDVFETACFNLPFGKDVIIVLNMPGGKGIKVELSEACPGFVTLNYSEGLQQLRSSHAPLLAFMEGLMDSRSEYLSRQRLEKWLENLFKEIFNKNPWIKGVSVDKWSLSFREANALKLEAKTDNGKKILINFVAGIKLYGDSWPYCKTKGICETKSDFWYAFPTTPFDCVANTDTEFQVVNPRAEILKLHDKSNLKPVYLLLREFRTKNGLFRIKNYYLTTLFLNEIDSQHCDFWIQDIDVIFFHMLKKLLEACDNFHLSYYWANRMNLFMQISHNDLLDFNDFLKELHKKLLIHSNDRYVTLEQCRSFFLFAYQTAVDIPSSLKSEF